MGKQSPHLISYEAEKISNRPASPNMTLMNNEQDLRKRIIGVDAYRGFVMFLMMAEVLELARVSRSFPESSLWSFLAYHQSHVEWAGCSLHDLIQPSFSFLVGVALPFSLASRESQGQTGLGMTLHAIWRAFILVFLGIFLRSMGRPQLNFTFEDTLTQIGLGYVPLFLIGRASSAVRWIALAAILVAYWAAFVAYPLPATSFDYASFGVPDKFPHDWPADGVSLAAHWNKNSNFAWAFDTWFLNLFPREQPFTHNGGGYATLSFIPTLGTMLLGLIAGGWLRANIQTSQKLVRLVVAGIVALAAGITLDRLGICPNVKRIWTPTWTLFSGGWCFLLLAAFYAVCDAWNFTAWAFPLRVIGANSITAYCMAHLIHGFVGSSFATLLGPTFFETFGEAYEPLFQGAAVLTVYWCILYWMYRNKIFLRV
jgi:predicted acyltransferase